MNRTQAFATALQELETTRDVEAFVAAAFAEDAELMRPETGQQVNGSGGARQFWQQYVGQFDDVRSQFVRVVEGDVGVLEWTSTGRLAGGADIAYAGISVLDFNEEDRVVRFATYYDTAPFGLPR